MLRYVQALLGAGAAVQAPGDPLPWFQLSLLERLLYKNKNQHKATFYFQRLQEVLISVST
jgi:hypothetical protein